MFTYDSIGQEIKSLQTGPITPASVDVLAKLLFIRDRLACPAKSLEEKEQAPENIAFSRELALKWTRGMQNADGATEPHWTMEETEAVQAQRGINCDPLAFWVAMNMMYSDYASAADKAGANTMDFYAYMAKAFLEDKDSHSKGGEKLARYYKYVVM